MGYDVAAYVWPAYTGDEPRTMPFWEEGIGEWQSVKNAEKKYEGDTWPRRPLWGYVNEADPYVMEAEIAAAADHGVNTFIYDWYWYDRRPFLEQCLNNGFLAAKNRSRMKFYLMWANHDAVNVWDKRLSDRPNVIWQGSVPREEFDRVCRRVIERYFVQDNYYFLCDVEEGVRPQKLDDYESDELFTLKYVRPETAIFSNRTKYHGPKDPVMLEREARVLEMLLSEGLID